MGNHKSDKDKKFGKTKQINIAEELISPMKKNHKADFFKAMKKLTEATVGAKIAMKKFGIVANKHKKQLEVKS